MSNKKNRPCPCGSGLRYRDCCSSKGAGRNDASAAPSSRFGFWLPSLLLGVPAVEIARSFGDHYYVNRALLVHHEMLNLLTNFCWGLALALLVIPPLRRWLAAHLDGPSCMPSPGKYFGPLYVSLAFGVLVSWIKFCQYRGFQLPMDTCEHTGIAFNTIHGRWFMDCAYGIANSLSFHIALTLKLFSPVLLFWHSALALLFIQALAIASTGLASYLLVYSLTESALAGFLLMLLTYAHPSFYELSSASLDDPIIAAAFFLWAMVFLVRRRPAWCALFLVLAATGREQFPFTLAGLGAYFIFARGRPGIKRLLCGLALILGSALLWKGEVALMHSFPSYRDYGESYWNLYALFGSNEKDILRFVLHHPFQTLWKCVYPWSRLGAFGQLLLCSALLPLAAPAECLVLLAAAVPQLLMIPGLQHEMHLQYASYTFGPLMFAAAADLARLWNRLRPLSPVPGAAPRRRGDRSAYLLIAALAAAGLGFRSSPRTLLWNWRLDMFDTIPPLIGEVPPGASIWVDEWMTAWVGCRAQVKSFGPVGMVPSSFYHLSFRPAYALIYKGWFVQTDPKGRDPFVTFFARSGYVKVDERDNYVLLRDPDPKAAEGLSPALVLPPVGPARLIQEYIQYVLAAPPGSSFKG